MQVLIITVGNLNNGYTLLIFDVTVNFNMTLFICHCSYIFITCNLSSFIKMAVDVDVAGRLKMVHLF